MIKILLPLALAVSVASTAVAQAPSPPSSALDGNWTGRSDGGSCNAPLDFALTIESGIVDGTAFDTTAKGPQPNLKKSAPPPPTPGLWQLHGLASGNSFSLTGLASVKAGDRRTGKFNVTNQGGTLAITESGGCGRTARLAKGG